MKDMRAILVLLFIHILSSNTWAQTASDSIVVQSSPNTVFIQHDEVLKINKLKEILNSKTISQDETKIASNHLAVAKVLGFAAGFAIGYPVGVKLSGGVPNWKLAIVGAGLFVVSIPFNLASLKHFKRAVKQYNASLR
jgi:hypothetical protein